MISTSKLAVEAEIRQGLLLYTAIVFVSTMLMCAQQISKSVATLTKNAEFDLWATMQFYWINDVMLCVPPFCLLMLSADLRKDIVNFLRCRRQRSGPTGPVSVRQSTMAKTLRAREFSWLFIVNLLAPTLSLAQLRC
ncbi:hypothetical protein OSTOST_14426 [Ostertagia ostertagi]